MPLNPLDGQTGLKLPRARWSTGDREAFARGVLREQRDNHMTGRAIDVTALDDAASLAEGNEALAREVSDVRTIVSTPIATRGAGGNSRNVA